MTMTMTTAPTATFHAFPHLPFELRARIWELTVEPRLVEVRVVHHDPSPVRATDRDAWTDGWMKRRLPPVRHVRSPTPVPAQLHTCREARERLSLHPHGGYQKALGEIATTPYDGFDPVPEDDPQRELDRYVWLNFAVDMVSIGKTDLRDFRAVAHQVRRLRLERPFPTPSMRSGYRVTDDIYFPCEPENVFFVDPQEMGGKMMSSVDLDAMMDRECVELDDPEEEG
ncbi:hypothetical protein N0V88_002739 [Collariella sp. IMI 366227]|nr:hypothetical protein N0V88_002739 [Collariella sp. IMI 366227]